MVQPASNETIRVQPSVACDQGTRRRVDDRPTPDDVDGGQIFCRSRPEVNQKKMPQAVAAPAGDAAPAPAQERGSFFSNMIQMLVIWQVPIHWTICSLAKNRELCIAFLNLRRIRCVRHQLPRKSQSVCMSHFQLVRYFVGGGAPSTPPPPKTDSATGSSPSIFFLPVLRFASYSFRLFCL
jgi:hypothetical protein